MGDTVIPKTSILNSVKKYIGVDPEYDVFDDQIIPLINSYLNVVNQLGVGITGFTIEDATSTWEDFIVEKPNTLHLVETFVKIRVRLAFDPPSNSFVTTALKQEADEMEWRLNVQVDPGDFPPNKVDNV
jgi:hypothetical protein